MIIICYSYTQGVILYRCSVTARPGSGRLLRVRAEIFTGKLRPMFFRLKGCFAGNPQSIRMYKGRASCLISGWKHFWLSASV